MTLKVYCVLHKTTVSRGWCGVKLSTDTETRRLMLSKAEALKYKAEGWHVQPEMCTKEHIKYTSPLDGKPGTTWREAYPHTRIMFCDKPALIYSVWP